MPPLSHRPGGVCGHVAQAEPTGCHGGQGPQDDRSAKVTEDVELHSGQRLMKQVRCLSGGMCWSWGMLYHRVKLVPHSASLIGPTTKLRQDHLGPYEASDLDETVLAPTRGVRFVGQGQPHLCQSTDVFFCRRPRYARGGICLSQFFMVHMLRFHGMSQKAGKLRFTANHVLPELDV